jgi:hypothetical protein
MLEKAWAKIHGSYHRIIKGSIPDTLRDLTGAPCNQYSLNLFPQMNISMLYSIQMKYIVMLSSKDANKLKEIGMDSKYAF